MELNSKSFGRGPALILLHGLFGSLDNWVSLARQLGEHFSVFVLDQRNHGKSPHAPEWDYPVMAEDLFTFMQSQGIFQAHLLGHSMGGKTVMQFAGMYPEMIDRMIVADMTPKAYPPHHTEILEALHQLDLSQITDRAAADSALAPGIPDSGVRQFLLKSLSRDSDKGFRWKFNLPVIYERYASILESVNLSAPFEGPTLFLFGEQSTYFQPEDEALLLSQFPQAQIHTLKGAGHWIHADQPTAFLQAVKDFLLA